MLEKKFYNLGARYLGMNNKQKCCANFSVRMKSFTDNNCILLHLGSFILNLDIFSPELCPFLLSEG